MRRCLFVLLISSTAAWAADPAPAPTPLSFSRQTKIFGKTFGISLIAAPNASQTGMTETFTATILGKSKPLIQAVVTPSADFSKGQLQLFVNGTQLGTSQGGFFQGEWSKNYALPAVNSNVTVVDIPLGPVTIQVNGGYALTGNVGADLLLGPGQGDASSMQTVQATVGAEVQAAANVSGSASVLVVRGGVNGQLDLADGDVETKADLYLAKRAPAFTSSGKLGFFGGAVGAFADYYSFWSGWKHFWNWTAYSWPGYCFSFNNGVQWNGKCGAKQ